MQKNRKCLVRHTLKLLCYDDLNTKLNTTTKRVYRRHAQGFVPLQVLSFNSCHLNKMVQNGTTIN